MYPVFSEDQDYFDEILEEDLNQHFQFEKYTERLWELAMKNQAYLCEDRCKAPDSFFLGAPWMKIGSVTAREGDKVDLIC